DEMADVTEGQAAAAAGAGILHVDRDRLADAAAGDGGRERRAAAHLLGHGEDLEAEPVGRGLDGAGIRFDRVEIDDVGIGRDLAGLVEGDRLFDQPRIAAAENVEEHLPSCQRSFSRRVKAMAARMISPRTIIWPETSRPIRIRPLLSMPM